MLEISYKDFDTVCYSVQHNIEQLIKHAVAIGVQININIGDLDNLKGKVDDMQQDIDDNTADNNDTAGKLNSLTVLVNAMDTQLTKLQQDFNTFNYAVTTDLGILKNRVDELEKKVG